MPDESRRGTGAYFGVAELVFGSAQTRGKP
jgi:hypothetical protein